MTLPVEWDGTSTTKRCHCGAKSVAGLVPGVALCRYHFVAYTWWRSHANKCYPNHPEVKEKQRAQREDALEAECVRVNKILE